MTYAVVQLFLHVLEHILGGMTLSQSLLLTIISPNVLGCDIYLCDIKQGRSEFLQLTAGYEN
jgi:5-bromo-4-chloroindolyl phosphate hydrolysis protein